MKKYLQAYRILNKVTPLERDCGELCFKACCRGDRSRGMLLFPGEEEIFLQEKQPGFHLSESNITLESGRKIFLLTCSGTCRREMRPLACRIFPLTPYLTEEGFLEIRPDIRSIAVCPIFEDPEQHPIREDFIDAIYDAFELLIEDETIVEFIGILSEDYDAMAGLVPE